MQSRIRGFAVGPSDAALKNCNIGAQLQSITSIIAPKLFWKIYFLYDFWCTQTFSFWAVLGLPEYWYEVWQLLTALYSDLRKIFLYRCTSTFSALNYCSGTFSNFSAIYMKCCAQTFPPIFGLFANFDRNFTKNVVPPSNENENHVVHLKEESILKKALKTASKSTHNPSHNACLNYVPPRAGRSSVTYKKTPIFTPTASARSSISPKLCTLIENNSKSTILKGGNHFSIQRIVFPSGAKMLIFGHWRTE